MKCTTGSYRKCYSGTLIPINKKRPKLFTTVAAQKLSKSDVVTTIPPT